MKIVLFNYAEMLALITSIFCIKWIYNTRYIYFVPYLLMTVIAELTAKYCGGRHLYILNNEIYNITTAIEFVFFFYLFFSTIKKRSFKSIIISLSGLYLIFFVINILFLQGFREFNTYTLLAGTINIIIFVFLYFYDAFENTEPVNMFKEPMFWVSIGIFLFYLGDFTFNVMYPYLKRNNLDKERELFHLINNNLIVFEYVCMSIALIICSRNRLVLKQQS